MPQIRIRQYIFDLPSRYEPGQTIDEAEAWALTKLRAENVRNNVMRLVKEATGALRPGQLLSGIEQAELTKAVTEYEAGYRFPLPPTSSVRRHSALEQEAHRIAFAELGEDVEQEELDRFAQLPETLERARRKLEFHGRLSQAALEELL